MDSAVIAVIGTLAGAIVTTASTLLGAFLANRHQRAIAERQFAHTIDQGLRTERRASFVEYLTSYSDLREKIVSIEREIASMPHEPPAESARERLTGRRNALRIAEYAHDESAKFSRAYQTLRITANDFTGQAAHDCTSRLWDLADREAIVDLSEFDIRWEAAKEARRRLRNAMRKELGALRNESTNSGPAD